MRLLLLLIGIAAAFIAIIAAVPSADAGGIVFPTGHNCDAKIGVTLNEGNHPVVWPYIDGVDIDFGDTHQDGTQDISISAGPPIGTVDGEIDPFGHVVASAPGDYFGHETRFDFEGDMDFWDRDMQYPKRLTGTYTIGGDGSLPGGKSIVYSFDCFYPPPEVLADADGDQFPKLLLAQVEFHTEASGHVVEPAAALLPTVLVRKLDDSIAEFNLQNPQAWTMQDQKFGPLESHFKRKHFEIKGEFGGSFIRESSEFKMHLAAELGGGQITSPISGYFRGNVSIDASQTTNQTDVPFGFRVVGDSFPLLNGAAQSGAWVYQTDPTRPFSGDVDLKTGQFSVTVPTIFFAENLALASANPQGPGPQPLGDGIPFVETVSGTFGPLAALIDGTDNCPDTPNQDQQDSDGDGIGDACEGFWWGDFTCDTFAGVSDALRTLQSVAGTSISAADRNGCPDFGDEFNDLTFGDWNCDGNVTPLDALILIANRADANSPPQPQGCPDPGDFISTVVA
jgi:hypothetical protein